VQSAVVQAASVRNFSLRSHERLEPTTRISPSLFTHTLSVFALTAPAPATTDNAVSRAIPRRTFLFVMKIPSSMLKCRGL